MLLHGPAKGGKKEKKFKGSLMFSSYYIHSCVSEGWPKKKIVPFFFFFSLLDSGKWDHWKRVDRYVYDVFVEFFLMQVEIYNGTVYFVFFLLYNFVGSFWFSLEKKKKAIKKMYNTANIVYKVSLFIFVVSTKVKLSPFFWLYYWMD